MPTESLLRPPRTPSIDCLVCASLLFAHFACAQSAPSLETGHQNQAGLTFSPDGNAAYWVTWNGHWGADATSPRRIYSSTLTNGRWSAPAPMPFSGSHPDDDPFVSPDGQWLYFVSERPAHENDADSDGDIWRYRLDGSGSLERLAVNTDAAEYSPVVVDSGALYFASAREPGIGRGDLYRAAPVDGGFGEAELLSANINSATGEWNLWVSGDEKEMLFEASSRSTNVSIPGDLYYSWQTEGGWVPAVPVSALNTEGSDLLPRLSADGLLLYYTVAPLGGHARLRAVEWPALRQRLREN